jgi:hypothetical protein
MSSGSVKQLKDFLNIILDSAGKARREGHETLSWTSIPSV